MDAQASVAVVTGGGRNLGKAIALHLARHGHDLVLAGPESGELEAAAQEVAAQGRRALAVTADVTRDNQVQALAERTREHFGRIDVLVNNAGIIGPHAPVERVAPAEWQQVLDVNLTGAFL